MCHAKSGVGYALGRLHHFNPVHYLINNNNNFESIPSSVSIYKGIQVFNS